MIDPAADPDFFQYVSSTKIDRTLAILDESHESDLDDKTISYYYFNLSLFPIHINARPRADFPYT